jgi:acyl-coenzyme A thioesterase PaaI-like protein
VSAPQGPDAPAPDSARPDIAAPVPWAAGPERRQLAAATRAFLDAVVRTGADPATLAEITATVEAATARLAATTFQRTLDITPDSYRREMSLVNGASHPFAPLLEMRQLDDGYAATGTLGPAFEGAPGLVHGGAVSLLFDHVMAWATTRAGRYGPSMTGTMSLAYRRPTPLGVPLTLTARVDEVSGRKVQVRAELQADGQVTVDGSALFIKLTEEHQRNVYRLSS